VNRPAGSSRQHDSADIGLLLLGAAFGVAAVLWLGGAAAIMLIGGRPRGAITAGVATFAHAGHPALAWPHTNRVPGPAGDGITN
jgi:hypothetical protein